MVCVAGACLFCFVLFFKDEGRTTRAHALYIYSRLPDSRLGKSKEVRSKYPEYKGEKGVDGEGMQVHAHFTSRAARDIDLC